MYSSSDVSRLLLCAFIAGQVDFQKESVECLQRNLITRVWTFYHSQSDHACFDHLSRETYAKQGFEANAFCRTP